MDIVIPDLAESVTEGDLGAWLKKAGEWVEKDEPIVELETDKATVELAAEASGTLEILVEAGRTVHVGDVIGRIAEGGEAAARPLEEESAEAEPERFARKAPEPAPEEPRPAPEKVGIGIVEREVGRPTATPRATDGRPADPPGARRERMSRLRQRIAERLVEAQRTAAILTTFNEVDMSAVLALRKEKGERFEAAHGVRLGFMSLFARASILALAEFPELNASIEGDEIVYHDFVNLGIAVGTPRGLVVPVLGNADRMSFAQIEVRIAELAAKARDGDIAIEDLQGGTFTISNGGIYGSMLSTPILNPPQSGILGMHKIEKRPVVIVNEKTGAEVILSRPMMYVALSYDHRIVDGEQAVTFLVRVKERLEDPTRMLLDT